jgi:hypothetical protein
MNAGEAVDIAIACVEAQEGRKGGDDRNPPSRWRSGAGAGHDA